MTKMYFAVFVLLALCACNIETMHSGATVQENRSVDLGKFEMARIELHMGAGELKVDGGASKLVDADFIYNVPAWKPVITSSTASFRADVKIEQPTGVSAIGNSDYKWNLHLNNDVPTEVITHLGAGE